jgi:uncharacterized phage-associated protein
MVKIDGILLSKYILKKSGQMNAIKLQKTMFFVEAFHLAIFNKSLVGESFEAWVNGPVLRSVYNEYKSQSKASYIISIPEFEEVIFWRKFENPKQLYIIDKVIEYFNRFGSQQLSESSHRHLPWKEAREGLGTNDKSDKPMSKDSIRKYYRKLLYNREESFLKELSIQLSTSISEGFQKKYSLAWAELAK